MNKLGYYESYKDKIGSNSFRISPSMLWKFYDTFTSRKEWYRSQVLGENTFSGNTSSVLGTCVHRAAEMYFYYKSIDKVEEELHAEIPLYLKENFTFNPDVDINDIDKSYRPMVYNLLQYLESIGNVDASEKEVIYKLDDNYYLAGTCDAIKGTTLIDYKTTSRKTPPEEIPIYYFKQLMAYAYALNKLGTAIDKLRLVWITKPSGGEVGVSGKVLKYYPSQVIPIEYTIQPEDFETIDEDLRRVIWFHNFIVRNNDIFIAKQLFGVAKLPNLIKED